MITGITPPPLPAAPTTLVATASGEDAVQLTWKNGAAGQNGIKVEASTDKALFYEIADLSAATSFVNTGLSNTRNLSYRVRAYNTGGYSAYSNVAGSLLPASGK